MCDKKEICNTRSGFVFLFFIEESRRVEFGKVTSSRRGRVSRLVLASSALEIERDSVADEQFAILPQNDGRGGP